MEAEFCYNILDNAQVIILVVLGGANFFSKNGGYMENIQKILYFSED